MTQQQAELSPETVLEQIKKNGATHVDWLPDSEDTGLLREILLPYDPGLMKAYEVSTQVNSARNQGPELILPLAQRPLI